MTAPYGAFWAAARTGGGTGALDKIEGSLLADKFMAALLESTDTARFYWLDDDASGSEGEAVVNPDTSPGTKSWLLLGLTLPNTGLHLLDTNASHDLIIKPGSDLTADRTLTLTTGDANRELSLTGDSTLNQDLQTTDSPTFAALTLGSDGNGGDALLYGGTASNSLRWDASENVLDIASTMKAADNVVDITVTDATTLSSGYGRAAYIGYTVSGSKSGSYAINGLGIDMTVSEACPTVAAVELYTAAISNKTVGNLYPFSIYCEDIGTAVSNFMALDIGINSTNLAASRHTGMRIRNHSGTAKSAIMIEEAFTDTILRHSPSGVDLKLITLDNGSSGIFYWDDSEQLFRFTHGIYAESLTIAGTLIGLDQSLKTTDKPTFGSTTTTNFLMGTEAGNNDEGIYNVMIGYQAGYNNDTTGSGEEGDQNVYIGYKSGYGDTYETLNTGFKNTALGNQTLWRNTTGYGNLAIGSGVLYDNTTGNSNVGIGNNALANNINGPSNMAIGSYSMGQNTSGERNIAIGTDSFKNNQTGTGNVAIGYEAIKGSTGSCSYNTVIGYRAGKLITTGGNNICIGYQVGDVLTTGTDNIIIGYDIDPSAADASNELNIGDFIKGDLTNKNINIICHNDEVVCNNNEVVFDC